MTIDSDGVMDGSEIKIFFFGDSIAFGQGVSPHLAWVPRLSAALESAVDAAGRHLLVQNPSMNGSTTRQALERIAYDVQAHAPDILVVQFGLNDCNFWATDHGLPRVSPGSFRENLKEIIWRGRHFGSKSVLLLTNHPTARNHETLPDTETTYEKSNKNYNAIIRRVADEFQGLVMLVDIERFFLDHIEKTGLSAGHFLLSDGLHLGPAGHDLYFAQVEPVLRMTLTKRLIGDVARSHLQEIAG